MRCAVTPMRVNGRRLPADQISASPGIVGELLVHDWPAGNSFGRAVRVARLTAIDEPNRADPLLPLFDPALVRVSAEALVLVGVEIGTDGAGVQVDYAQSWLVRPLP